MDSLFRSIRPITAVAVTLLAAAGCSPSSLVDVQSPSNVVDPRSVHTAESAISLHAGAVVRMMGAFGAYPNSSVIAMSGFLTDELTNTQSSSGNSADNRTVVSTAASNGGWGYAQIQSARVTANQARQALVLYAPDSPTTPRAWEGELMAFEGYSILWFAELYCSGIPLSSAPLVGTPTPTRGFTTQELYARALALFDSAIVAGADSARYVNLASVGKGRVLLDLGRFAEADSAVRNVPTDFVYLVPSLVSGGDSYGYFRFPIQTGFSRVQDHEGGNGLVWSTDPRTGTVTVPSQAGAMVWPSKYNVTSSGTFDPTVGILGVSLRLADGLEARLIQAEAALAAGDPAWLTILNTLRATCIGSAPCAPVPGLTSTSLPPLSDPGAATRLDTVMKERAMWLYLTGHREGDLRRMAHVYNRPPETLWPTGTMYAPPFSPLYDQTLAENGKPYGPDVVFAPDPNEQLRNPLYGGCYNTNP